ncbi:Lrp/AsnC family transcriptional regulator [Rhabdaerophilum sp.]|uniref:Lrp/AsnC family transcriptional regulator n=1 Tax=Rhabdaerophilum sp. TaxID=2717341 RepID=UPI0038D43EC9
MDDLDQRLITLLRHDGRRSVSDLALALDASRATIRARMQRLEASGEVIGYTVVLKADVVSAPVRGITLIEVEGRAKDRVVDALSGFAEITAIHTTSGKWDLIAELSTGSLTALDGLLHRIRLITGIGASETHLLLATPRSSQARLTAGQENWSDLPRSKGQD